MKRTLIIIIAAALLTAGACAGAQELAATLKLISPADINAGDPVRVAFQVENAGAETLMIPAHFFGTGAADGTGVFFTVLDENRAPLYTVCPAAKAGPAEAVVGFRPGEFHGIKSYELTLCYNFEGGRKYSITAEFSSRSSAKGVWNGAATSNAVEITVKESETKKKSKIADAVIMQWLYNYEYQTAAAVKEKLASLGTAAAPAIVLALRKEKRMLPANDLLELLGSLPCRETVDALIQFITTAREEQFSSNMPDGFSSASLLTDTAIRSLEKVAAEKFSSDDGDVTEQWKEWYKKNRDTFRPALPE